MTPRFSCRLERLAASPIREILSVIDRPGMISLAGGLPAPDAFPELDVAQVPATFLQYGPTPGEEALRVEVARRLCGSGLQCAADQVIILSGSQQGIDLVAKLFVDPGTPIALESPTYLAALQVFQFYGARAGCFEVGSARAAWQRDPPAFAYVIPTFQNPTGHCYSAAERRELATACEAAGVPLFEDDPYRELAYEDCERTPVCAQLRDVPWIYQGSFSKTLAPGLRLGFIVAARPLLPALIRLKQAADLHSSRISQWLVLRQLTDPAFDSRLRSVVQRYRVRRDTFAAALAQEFPDLACWQVPAGGLFFWLRLRAALDTRAVLPAAIERGVAFMPGEPFHPQGAATQASLRLNFTHATEERAREGLARLGDLLRTSCSAVAG